MFVWTIETVVMAVLVTGYVLVLASYVLAVSFPAWWKSQGCKHDGGVTETQACDAICRKCGKNLGFIGAWRTRMKK